MAYETIDQTHCSSQASQVLPWPSISNTHNFHSWFISKMFLDSLSNIQSQEMRARESLPRDINTKILTKNWFDPIPKQHCMFQMTSLSQFSRLFPTFLRWFARLLRHVHNFTEALFLNPGTTRGALVRKENQHNYLFNNDYKQNKIFMEQCDKGTNRQQLSSKQSIHNIDLLNNNSIRPQHQYL